MPVTLGSNIASLRGQRQLARTSGELGTVFERLSSGQRINKASDDAAGLAIADSLRADCRVFTQGIRNLNDGASLLAVADAAVSELVGIVTRITELAEQAANGIYSIEQRKALDNEAQALSKEYGRIVEATTFNNLTLLDGSTPYVRLQTGYGLKGSIKADLTDGLSQAIGLSTFSLSGSATVASDDALQESLQMGDFDRDGDVDVIMGTNSGNTSLVYNNGDGTLGSVIDLGSRNTTIAIGDVNGDGFLDYVGASYPAASVELNLGSGTFSTAQTFPSNDLDYELADVNKDGKLDMLSVEDGGTPMVRVRLGNGTGTFGAEATFSLTSFNLNSMTVGDLNGDGSLDIVVHGHAVPFVDVLLGNGDGTFGAKTNIDNTGGAADVEVGDINSDGRLDIISGADDRLEVYLGNGDGTFGAEVDYLHNGNFGSFIDLVLADINNDGNLDALSTGGDSNVVALLLGKGDGTFDSARTISVASANNIGVGDFNGDGVLDFVVHSDNNDLLSIYVQDTATQEAGLRLRSFSLRSVVDARSTLDLMKDELNDLLKVRSVIGGSMSRIDAAANYARALRESLSSAESVLRDADIAEESSRLVRLQILKQASAAVLTHANQQPALALSLLG